MEHLGFPPLTIAIFTIFVILSLGIDFLGHKDDKPMHLKSSSIWSLFWIFISILFGLFIYYEHGKEMASLFFAGYILEKSLSVDNLFVIMAIFSWFKIPQDYRHRVLYFGIIGAILFRLIFVAIGSSLFFLSHWVQLVFGLIILWTAIIMLKKGDEKEEIEDYSSHLAYKLVYKYFSVFPKIVGHYFFISRKTLTLTLQENPNIKFSDKGAIIATPLFLCLCIIEFSDVMFAFDSVPAVIAVSQEPLIIYSAMIFAILGLRALYFVLEALKEYLIHLEKAVIVLLFFIAIKILLNASYNMFGIGFEIPPLISLYVIAFILFTGIFLSVVLPRK